MHEKGTDWEVKMKKRIGLVVLCLVIATFFMVGCGEKGKTGDKKLSVVTTIFPEYDWTKQIMGDKAKDADITMLLDNGVDLHSYQPSAEDIAKISKCDVFIYVGGESDGWVKDALKEATNKDMKVINLLEVLGKEVKDEEVKEGMQEEEHDHDHDKDADHGHEDEDHDKDADHDHEDEEGHHHEHGEEPEKDEHVWLSLRKAETCTNAIAKALSEVDKDNKELYEKNAKEYISKLADLDKEYKKAVSDSSKKTVVFGDRFPFRYLVDDYDIDYFAAFVGCSAESEASFNTVKFLAEKVDSLGLKNVMTIEKNDHKIAKTIIENTKTKDQKILTMDSMQSTTAKDVKQGANYLDIMKKNLEVLKEAIK